MGGRGGAATNGLGGGATTVGATTTEGGATAITGGGVAIVLLESSSAVVVVNDADSTPAPSVGAAGGEIFVDSITCFLAAALSMALGGPGLFLSLAGGRGPEGGSGIAVGATRAAEAVEAACTFLSSSSSVSPEIESGPLRCLGVLPAVGEIVPSPPLLVGLKATCPGDKERSGSEEEDDDAPLDDPDEARRRFNSAISSIASFNWR